MTTTVVHKNQTIAITDVSKVQVTEIENGEDGVVRAIRVYGELGSTFPPVVELIISAATADEIKITTPELTY